MSPGEARIAMLAASGIGAVFFVLAVIRFASAHAFYARARKVHGTLVRYGTDLGAENRVIYRPFVSFTAEDGRTIIEARSPTADNFGWGRAGRQIRLWYDPDAPERIRLAGIRGTMYSRAVAFLTLALILALLAWIWSTVA